MKRPLNNIKLLISILLIFLIIGTISFPVFAQNIGLTNKSTKKESNYNTDIVSEVMERKEETPVTLQQEITILAQPESMIDTIIARSVEIRKQRLHSQDEFNYNQKDVEELLLDGFTLEDIYRSDQIGNQFLVSPRELINLKIIEKKTWDEVETDIAINTKNQLNELANRHPNLEAKTANLTISEAEKLEILKFVELNPDQNLGNIISTYKTEGRFGLKKLHEKLNGKGDNTK